MTDALAFLRPFDALSTALYAAAFRAGRRLGCQVRERCGEASRSAESAPEAIQVPDVSAFVLPGATIEGIEVDPFAPTPENSLVVDLCATGDDDFHAAMWAASTPPGKVKGALTLRPLRGAHGGPPATGPWRGSPPPGSGLPPIRAARTAGVRRGRRRAAGLVVIDENGGGAGVRLRKGEA